MIDLTPITSYKLQTQPFGWAEIDKLFSPSDAVALASSYPDDHFKTVVGYGGEKDYEYEARALIPMGASSISYPDELSPEWLALMRDFLSPAYRAAMSSLTGRDLAELPMEVNVHHYGSGACLGPHLDMPEKVVTHVLYFNQSWKREDGGCLSILEGPDPARIKAQILPLVGNSAVLVRSEKSWHEVQRVVDGCQSSRRSMNVTFYRPGSASTMWPPGENAPLHRYGAVHATGNRAP